MKKTAAAIILAAGQGTRMQSELTKVLHPIAGLPMVEHVLRSVNQAGLSTVYLVIGHQGDQVQAALPNVSCVTQKEQKGTGHAVDQCREVLADFDGPVLVTYGDTPLFRGETFRQLLEFHKQEKVAATVITSIFDDPTGYGRIVRDDRGDVVRIVEQKDADETTQLIKEINTGTYCFDSKLLFHYLSKITPDNAQAEYYLPDVLPMMIAEGYRVAGFVLEDATESMGVNHRVQLAKADRILRQRVREEWMLKGVTMIDPESTYIDVDCEIGRDTLLYPGTFLQGKTVLGENCVIGPNTRIVNAQLGNGVQADNAVIVDCVIGSHSQIGPFCYVRPGTVIGDYCKLGDFVEVKNSSVADHSKIPHHSYIGDAQIGRNVNIGAGTITCNYDGEKKHKTVIEDNAFVGSNSNLVAPVTIGAGAYVAAGSTITQDVPEESLGIGRARQVTKIGWKKRRVTGDQ